MPGSFHFIVGTLAFCLDSEKNSQMLRKRDLKEDDFKVEDSVTANWLMKPHITHPKDFLSFSGYLKPAAGIVKSRIRESEDYGRNRFFFLNMQFI
jgi:hypothetical protein